MNRFFLIALFCLSSCSTTKQSTGPADAVQLVVWEFSNTEACETDARAVAADHPRRLAVGLAYWPSALTGKSAWKAYGAEANFLFGSRGPDQVCVALVRSPKPSQPNAKILLSAKLSLMDDGVLIDDVHPDSGAVVAARLEVKNFAQNISPPAVSWNFPNSEASIRKIAWKPSEDRIRVVVAISHEGGEHQLEAAVSQITQSTVPTITTLPPRRSDR